MPADAPNPAVTDSNRTPRAKREDVVGLALRVGELEGKLEISEECLAKCRMMLRRAIGDKFDIEDIAEKML